MTVPAIGPGRAVEVLYDRGPATPVGVDRWTAGSGYLIGGRLVLTAAHAVGYRQDLDHDAQLLVRTRRGGERLRPRAGGPSRTLKSLLQQEAIGLRERALLPLLFAAEQLVAAADLWVDARWQPGADCERRLRLIWHRPA